jgi:hypothetical protein
VCPGRVLRVVRNVLHADDLIVVHIRLLEEGKKRGDVAGVPLCPNPHGGGKNELLWTVVGTRRSGARLHHRSETLIPPRAAFPGPEKDGARKEPDFA